MTRIVKIVVNAATVKVIDVARIVKIVVAVATTTEIATGAKAVAGFFSCFVSVCNHRSHPPNIPRNQASSLPYSFSSFPLRVASTAELSSPPNRRSNNYPLHATPTRDPGAPSTCSPMPLSTCPTL